MSLFTPAHWAWPQYTETILLLVGLGVAMATHGQPQTGKRNFWASLIVTTLVAGILYFGGFFAPR